MRRYAKAIAALLVPLLVAGVEYTLTGDFDRSALSGGLTAALTGIAVLLTPNTETE